MPSNIDRSLADDAFGTIEAKLALIRTAATAPPDAPESWFKRTFAPAPPSSRQSEIDAALADALQALVALLREKAATHAVRFEQLEQNVAELRSVLTSVRELQERFVVTLAGVRELQERSAATETLLAQLRQEQGEVRNRLATAGQELVQSGQEQSEKINQLAAGQENLANELGERIQHLLDEQRVCLRQVSLKTSEEAVLADRARRATELRLEEIARRLPEHPA
jgi:septal ring factor EnvC (AmiA/AmiB activator)